MKVVITGGGGFLGRRLGGKLVEVGTLTGSDGQPHAIDKIVLFDAVAPAHALDDPRVSVVIGDIGEASVVNDVSGLQHDSGIAHVVAESPDVSLIIGHIRGTPTDMQLAPRYEDVLLEVATELEASVAIARDAGVPDARLAVDPGIGFGKGLEDNLQLIAHAGWLRDRLGLPVLIGPSRKSFLGTLTGDPVERRETATQAACAVAAFTGADAVRVHDADAARRAVAVGRALREARRKELS